MKKAIVLAIIIAYGLTAVAGWSQVPADPNDEIYQFLLIWQQKGYVTHLPQIRPYPLQVIKQALTSVIETGSPQDSRVAREYWDALIDGGSPVPVNLEGFHTSQLRNEDYQARFGFGLKSTGEITEKLTYSAKGRLMLERVPDDDVYPRWSDNYESTIYTEARFTGQYGFAFLGQDLNAYGAFNGLFSYGTDRLSGQIGLVRSSFGPFINSPVVGPQAPLAGHFSATYRSSKVSISMMFLELVARYGVARDGSIYTIKGNVDFYPSKHLVLHAIDIHPYPWLSAGIFQTAIIGARFSPIYLFPFTQYVQNYFGDWDNSFVGAHATVKLPLDLQFDTIVFVDDINLSRMLQLDFNSNNNRIASRTGLSWIAPVDLPNRVELTYVFLTPYVYTHYLSTPASYLQYTHQGEHLGSILEPNSDQWNLQMFLMPADWIQVEAWFSRTRHGNGSDYGEGSVDGDGSVFDDGTLADGTRTYTGPSSFLIQSVLEQVVQLGLSAGIDLTWGPIDAAITGEYTFEIVRNKDLVADVPEETNHYVHLGLTLSY